MTHIDIQFRDSHTMSFDVEGDVDFNRFTGHYLSFNNTFINLDNVLYMNKTEVNENGNK